MKRASAVFNTFRLSTVLLFSLASTMFAQQPQPPGIAPAPAIPSPELDIPAAANSTPMPDPTQGLIRVDVSVSDKAGKPVTGLSENDFTLLDNDRPQKIVTFRAFGAIGRPAPSLEVVLVIDELNMLQDSPQETGTATKSSAHATNPKEQAEVRDAVREVETFLRANGGALEEPTIIYRLTVDGLFATPHPSTDGNELADEIEQPSQQRQIWSPSMIAKYIGDPDKDGAASWRIAHSIVALGSISIEERRKPERKLLFWIGNAWQMENLSAGGLYNFSTELLTRMREARITLWAPQSGPCTAPMEAHTTATDMTATETRRPSGTIGLSRTMSIRNFSQDRSPIPTISAISRCRLLPRGVEAVCWMRAIINSLR